MSCTQRFLFTALMIAGWSGTLLAADLGRTGDHDYDPPEPGSYSLPKVKAAADGDVLDSTGRPCRLRELTRGSVTVLSFIYTRCAAAKACPYATGVLKQLYQLSTQDADLSRLGVVGQNSKSVIASHQGY